MFVSEFSVWVTSAYERYTLAKNLINNSKNDSPTEPYRSKYEAKNILSQLVSEIDVKWKSYGINIQVKMLYSLFNYEIGLIALETDETSAGCDALYLSLDHIRDIANTPEGCHLALKVLNQVAIVWSERGENGKALEELLTAEKMYYEYKLTHENCPYDSIDMFMLDNAAEREWSNFEKTFTHTLYYLAQVYELADNNEKAAGYCRETLERQRESGYYELVDWSSNCATLSQFYVVKKNFKEACHLLCAATDGAHKREIELNEKEVDEEKDVWGEYHKVVASISCCWIKYCITLIQESHDGGTVAVGEKTTNEQEFIRVTTDKSVLAMEDTILTSVSSFEDAKTLFLFAVNHVKEAKLHYTLNQYANNYVQIVRDHSNLYKCLTYFESDLSRQCKMLKRRIDMLEEVLKKLNPQYYLSVCRQLQFELGEIYFEMFQTKLKIKEASAAISSSVIKKVNSLITQGISHFEAFAKSLQDKTGKYPETFSEENVRTVLLAHFYMGRLHTKLIEGDSNRKLHNLSKSEECFEFIVNYIEKNPNHSSYIEEEFKLSKEILDLMPGTKAQVTGLTLF